MFVLNSGIYCDVNTFLYHQSENSKCEILKVTDPYILILGHTLINSYLYVHILSITSETRVHN